MKKDEFISIADFAKRAGVSRTYIYKSLSTRLAPFYKQVDGQKMLNTSALSMFDVNNIVNKEVNKETGGDTLMSLVEILQEQQKTLKAELDIKNEQIKALNMQTSQQLQLIDQQQKLQAISEKKRLEANPEPVRTQETLLNREKFTTEAEYSQYLLRLLPKSGIFASRQDRQEVKKVLQLMNEYERKLILRNKSAKEYIEKLLKTDFDQVEKDIQEAEREAEQMRTEHEKMMRDLATELNNTPS